MHLTAADTNVETRGTLPKPPLLRLDQLTNQNAATDVFLSKIGQHGTTQSVLMPRGLCHDEIALFPLSQSRVKNGSMSSGNTSLSLGFRMNQIFSNACVT